MEKHLFNIKVGASLWALRKVVLIMEKHLFNITVGASLWALRKVVLIRPYVFGIFRALCKY